MPGGDQRFLSDPLVTGAQALPAPRGHYRPALDLAVSVITQRAIVLGEGGGPVQMASVVLLEARRVTRLAGHHPLIRPVVR